MTMPGSSLNLFRSSSSTLISVIRLLFCTANTITLNNRAAFTSSSPLSSMVTVSCSMLLRNLKMLVGIIFSASTTYWNGSTLVVEYSDLAPTLHRYRVVTVSVPVMAIPFSTIACSSIWISPSEWINWYMGISGFWILACSAILHLLLPLRSRLLSCTSVVNASISLSTPYTSDSTSIFSSS